MQFNSFIFLICLLLAVPVYYLLPQNLRKYFLILCNYLFYSYFDYRLTILLFGLTSSTYIFGNIISASENEKLKKYLFWSGVAVNLFALGLFKYFNFFIASFHNFLNVFGLESGLSTLNILMPLGISFYVFQTLTFLFDNYFGTLKTRYTFSEYTLFASFFPTIIAGPIERASRLLPQIREGIKFSPSNNSKGLALITIGMFRKVLIGDGSGLIIDQVFAEPNYYLSPELLITVFLYSFQLYNDFAGYSAIARGVAKLFGFDIFSNFRQPFFATSITDFWRKWHISLALWLRDYLFKPLQFSLRNLRIWGNVAAIMITFVICGLWHGPTWNYVFWGFLQGFYMAFSLLTQKKRSKILIALNLPAKLIFTSRVILTFILITISFLFFRTENFSHTFQIMAIISDWQSSELTVRFLQIFIAVSITSTVIDLLEMKFKSQAFLAKLKPAVNLGVSLALWFVIILYLMTSNKLPFIYAQF